MQELGRAAKTALDGRDGRRLLSLLRLANVDSDTGSLMVHATEELLAANPLAGDGPTAEKDAKRFFPGVRQPYPLVLVRRLRAGAAVAAQNWPDAHAQMLEALKTFYEDLRKPDQNWSIEVLHGLAADVRVLADQADEDSRAKGQKATALHATEFHLKKGFTACISDRSATNTKKWGALEMANNLLKIYFKLNSLHLCKAIITPVENPQLCPPTEEFPIAHQATYRYLIGRYRLYEDRPTEAVRHLLFSFRAIPPRYFRQRRAILQYLIPARMLLGIIPSTKLLSDFRITQYTDIVGAVKSGNVNQFDESAVKHQEVFIQQGVFLAIERIRSLVYRSLFRSVYKIKKTNKLPLGSFVQALKVARSEMSVEEVECVLANLIYEGYIKGYISHEKSFLVVSAKDAFPSLKNISVG